jgi:hypothetical protein
MNLIFLLCCSRAIQTILSNLKEEESKLSEAHAEQELSGVFKNKNTANYFGIRTSPSASQFDWKFEAAGGDCNLFLLLMVLS